jgi:hypothetical protein
MASEQRESDSGFSILQLRSTDRLHAKESVKRKHRKWPDIRAVTGSESLSVVDQVRTLLFEGNDRGVSLARHR